MIIAPIPPYIEINDMNCLALLREIDRYRSIMQQNPQDITLNQINYLNSLIKVLASIDAFAEFLQHERDTDIPTRTPAISVTRLTEFFIKEKHSYRVVEVDNLHTMCKTT